MLCDECNKNEVMGGDGKFREYCHECVTLTRECRSCHEVKSIFEFEKNQRTPKGVRNRRQECKDCRKRRKGVPAKNKREYQEKNPPPIVGDIFYCPICERMFTVEERLVNLDHDSGTGEIRGYICSDCNTSMGRLGDDISTLARAILWIKNKGKIFNR